MAEKELTKKEIEELIKHVKDDIGRMRKFREEAYKAHANWGPERQTDIARDVKHFKDRAKQLNDRLSELEKDYQDISKNKQVKKSKEQDRNKGRGWER